MKLNKKKIKGQWFEYDNKGDKIELFIRPFSAFLLGTTPMDDNDMLSQETIIKIIRYTLTDWKNILDEDGKELTCNDENKVMLCDTVPEIFSFVMEKSQLLREEILIKEEELKN